MMQGETKDLFNSPANFLTDGEKELAIAATEEGIARAEAGAMREWRGLAIWALERAARNHEEFTADDVWAILETARVSPPREPSAMGPILREGRALGYCISTNKTRESRRPKAHRRPLRVWASPFFD
jgi:hypothetical protein